MKKRVVVVCPGRGSYTKETLGYLRAHGRHVTDFINDIDERRRALSEPTITELDNAEVFKPNLHTRGEHASPLIYACAYADFMAIDRERYEIVAVTGNSMGWYLAMAYAGSLDWKGGFDVVNSMGSMMKNETIGGQVIYPVCDESWRKSKAREAEILAIAAEVAGRDGCEVYKSIDLGGYVVFGANKAGVAALLKRLPKIDDYPFALINHAAFHTPLLRSTSERAFETLPMTLFQKPQIPMIDGRGCVWQPFSTKIDDLYSYTLGHQVVEMYDFTRAVTVALREFAPDQLILLGPGGSLGGSIAQVMIENDWNGLKTKEQFTKLQLENPVLLSIGRPEQRALVAKS